MTTVQTATQAPAQKDKPTPTPANGHAAAENKPPPVLPVDLSTLSDAVLDALLPAVEREIETRRAQKEAALVAYVRETAAILRIPDARLIAALRPKPASRPSTSGTRDRRHEVRPLLWNPLDHSQRWSKRGAKPQWYVDHLAGGGTEDECRIPEGAS
jgi:hypothetical protein